MEAQIGPEDRQGEKQRQLEESREGVKSGMRLKFDAQYLLIRLSACCEWCLWLWLM